MRKPNRSMEELEENREASMSFSEIGKVLGMKDWQAERIFNRAMAKLGSPKMAKKLWEYKNISEGAPSVAPE